MTVSPPPTGPTSGVVADFDMAPLAQTALWDDFDGPAGSKPNGDLWKLDTINQGGIQTYTPDNVFLDGAGRLVLQATKDAAGKYFSGRVTTRRKFNMQYGRVSANIKFPAGQGLWPAFWLLGFQTPNNYPEIDIIEMVNTGANWYSSIHTTNRASAFTRGGPIAAGAGSLGDLSTGFHTYWLDWKPDSITTGVDDTTWTTFTPAGFATIGQALPEKGDLSTGIGNFNAPMYAIMNLAVGGSWAGPPDATTGFPSQMLVDWFRYTPW